MTPEAMVERVAQGDRPTLHPKTGLRQFEGRTITHMARLDPTRYPETDPMFMVKVEDYDGLVLVFADEVVFSPTREVHAYDDTPCTRSALHYGEAVCIHGYQLIEVWVAT